MIELNRIYNEDCLETMKKINDNSINLIVADPPYFQVVKEQWDNQWNSEFDYLDWCKSWAKECVRILKPNGNIVIWGQLGEKYIAFARILIMLEDEFKELNRKNIVSVKRTKGQGTSTNFMSNREEFVWLTKGKKGYTFNKQYTIEEKQQYGYKRNKDKPKYKVAGNIWSDVIYPWFGSKSEKYYNTAQKPLMVCDRIINGLSNEGDLVYIPFTGSGSEILSCISNKRHYIASEVNKEYINEIVLPRIEKLESTM